MRLIRHLAIAALLAGFLPHVSHGCDWDVTQLTDNDYDDTGPRLDNRQAAWIGDFDVFYWDGHTTSQITTGSPSAQCMELDNGQISWLQEHATGPGTYELDLYFWNGASTIHVADNLRNAVALPHPQLHDGEIVWHNAIGRLPLSVNIFYWDGATTHQITDHPYYQLFPDIYDGQITWSGQSSYSMHSDFEIRLSDGTTTTELTDNTYDDRDPRINEGDITWVGDGDIFYSDGSSTTQVTSSGTSSNPQLDHGQIVWESGGDVFYWDGTAITRISDNPGEDLRPYVHDGQVTWYGYDGNDYEVFYWDGSSVSQVTDNDWDDTSARISDGIWGGQITWQSQVDGEDWEIMVAEPTPEPATWLLLAATGAFGVVIRRRRSK